MGDLHRLTPGGPAATWTKPLRYKVHGKVAFQCQGGAHGDYHISMNIECYIDNLIELNSVNSEIEKKRMKTDITENRNTEIIV